MKCIAGLLPLLVSACLAAQTTSPTKTLQAFEAVEPHMGTLVRIKLYAADAETAKAAFTDAFQRVAEIDNSLSDYKPDSELNRISRLAVGRPVPIQNDLLQVLEAAQEVSEQTSGAFDATIGPLTHLWREAKKQRRKPDQAAIQTAMQRCGYRKMHLDIANKTVMFDMPGMQLDLGGIAKGYAADQALMVMERRGISSALVAVSGDLAFSNAPPGQSGWKIGVDSLDTAGKPFTRVLTIANAAVSTSGDQEQHTDVEGERYSHILDSKTGIGLKHGPTMTIIARHCMQADANATAVSVLGWDRGRAYIKTQPHLAAILARENSSGAEVVETTRLRNFKAGN